MNAVDELKSVSRSFQLLRSFAQKRGPAERCELCGAELSPDHQHLLEPVQRKVLCACGACSVLFTNRGETKYKRVPRRVRFLTDFQMTEGQWASLMIPINMAFFFKSTLENRMVALYPSPAGPIESLLSLDSWNDIIVENPELNGMEPDVEALLVNRIAQFRGTGSPEDGVAEYFIAPIDECYKLVGLIRGSWRGFSGGTEVWREIARFFENLKEKACRT